MTFTDKHEVLKEFFGHGQFRAGQEELIDAILKGQDVLGIMPTGAGKSLCYQVPALMLAGITIVVSPLISLMKDQVSSLVQSGVPCAYLNSSLTAPQYAKALQNAAAGRYKVIYAAPERLCTQGFLELCAKVRVSMVTVDEAHCVSQWGQDFRPSYMRIPEFLSRLGYRPIVSAFTATATAAVKNDIIRMLSLQSPVVKTTGFDRQNLYFGVMQPKSKYKALREIILRNKDKSGIIYCSTRKHTERICEKLCADGILCTRYHAGLSDEERIKNQDDFIFDRKPVIAATNAFGMGIDKSNVSFVVHYDMPKNIESYYQEAGRAGRDGSEAECILLYSPGDVRTNEFLIENSNENADLDPQTAAMLRQRDMKRLELMRDYALHEGCLREYILNYFGEQTDSERCGKCSNCEGKYTEQDITIESQKILSCIYRLYQRRLRFGMTVIAQVLTGAENDKIERFGLKTLTTYGIMKGETQVRIRAIIRHLQVKGFIAVDEHSALTLTERSAPVLRGEQKVTMRLREEKRPSKTPTGALVDTQLFSRLRNVRTELAKTMGVPPYIICSDQSLRDMCSKLPESPSELTAVSGFGKVKADRYGEHFIAVIKDYLSEGEGATYKYISTEHFTSLYDAVVPNAGKLKPLDETVTVRRFCDDILSQLGLNIKTGTLSNAVNEWLVNENYLCRRENGRLHTTILSEEAGLSAQSHISERGTHYFSIVIDPQGQEFLIMNLEDILKGK